MSEQGVLRQTTDKNGKSITEFLPINIYYEENETVYLDPNVFKKMMFSFNRSLPKHISFEKRSIL